MKGYALLIGVNELNQTHYLNKIELQCALTDTKLLKESLDAMNSFEHIECLNYDQASWSNTCNIFDKYIELSKNESGYFFIYYTGHGSCGGENSIGFFSFYDRFVSEYEIKRQLSKLNEKFKVFLLSDSCHSGELNDDNNKSSFRNSINERKVRFLDTASICNELVDLEKIDDQLVNFISSNQLKTGEVKTISEDVFKEICAANPNDYSLNILNETESEFTPNAEIAVLTACKKNQRAEGNVSENMPSLFTRTVLTTWQKNQTHGYYSFHRDLVQKNSDSSSPEFKIYGKNKTDFFNVTAPFKFNQACVFELLSDTHFEEDGVQIVRFDKFPDNTNYCFTSSLSYKITDSRIEYILNQITLDCLENIGVIGVVYATEHTQTCLLNLPQPIMGLKPSLVNASYALVLVVDWITGRVLFKGRTKGKVSNDVGF